MEAARPRARRRRQRREGAGTPLDVRLVRAGLVVVLPGVLALLVASSTPGTLPRPALEPLFDGKAARVLATTLSLEYPSRVPGTPEAAAATRWYEETMDGLGIASEEDVWDETLPDLGRVTLRNVVATVPGRSDDAVLVVAHRDNAGSDEAGADNASGTAALLELARAYAPQDGGPDPRPQHTLVFVSTDAGAYGGAGARRLAATPFAAAATAAVVVGTLAGDSGPRLAVAGDDASSPSRVLVQTAAARLGEHTGERPAFPSMLTQLVDLGLPFGDGEQGRLLGRGVPAVTLTTSGSAEAPPGTIAAAGIPPASRLGALGAGLEALVDSLDSSAAARPKTPDALFVSDRVLSGWAVRLTLVLLVVPMTIAVVDLVARTRRRGIALRPGWLAFGAHLLTWGWAAALVALAARVGVFPTDGGLPLPPFASVVSDPPLLAIAGLLVVFVAGWTAARRRLATRTRTAPAEPAAAHAVASVVLCTLGVALAIVAPYALVFLLPALYAWPSLPVERAGWRSLALVAAGLAGPIAALTVLAGQVGISPFAAPLYVTGLVTVGYAPLLFVIGAVVFGAAASQFARVAAGRRA